MINPIALLLFCICGITGYLLGDINGMLYGFLIPC